jgi:hypothetical protein
MPLIQVLLMALGPVVLAVGLMLMRRHDAPRPTQVVSEGTVLRWEHRPVGSTVAPRELGSLPVVRFSTAQGRQVEGMPRWAADRGIYRSGHRVEVRYDHDDPTSFVIRQGWLDRPYAYVVLAGAGLTFLTLVLPLVLRSFF